MEINYYRYPNAQGEGESWQNCQFTHETELSPFSRVKPLVSLNGQPIVRQHHVTYLTGKDTCRAHHFAKYLAIQVLTSGSTQAVEVVRATGSYKSTPSSPCKVLWIDTLHGPHICTQIYHELVAQATAKENLHFVCLDILGGQRDNFYAINRNIETLIKQLNPELVVIDDIDHFMPFCGVRIATEFCRIVRDVTNHSETAFLFIGYNHLGKKASTTGNLGKYLFLDATDVFSLSTQREITTVRLTTSYDLSRSPEDTQFRFTIGEDNLPHEAERDPKCKAIDDVKQDELDRCNTSSNNNSNQLSINNKHKSVNNSLTLPPHPLPSQSCPVNGDVIAVPSPSQCCPVNGDAIAVPSPSQRCQVNSDAIAVPSPPQCCPVNGDGIAVPPSQPVP